MKTQRNDSSTTIAFAAALLLAVLCLPAAAETVYEAEAGVRMGTDTNSKGDGFSGTGFVTGFDQDDDSVAVSVTVPQAGLYPLTIRYRSMYGNKHNEILVNGVRLGSPVFVKSETFRDFAFGAVRLHKGPNAVAVRKEWGWIDVDQFRIGARMAEAKVAARARPRVIATTDGEIDDRSSMVRFLLSANEWDIEGIVYTSSKFHWKGNEWGGETWIQRDIDLYAKVYPMLKRHGDGYPTPRALKKLVSVGNIDAPGDMAKATRGSNRIVKVLLDKKPGPVYLQAWGGTNTIARALKTIQEKYPAAMKRVSQKAVIYIILDQDDTFTDYILPNWPDLQVLASFQQFRCINDQWNAAMPGDILPFFEAPWMKANILEGHGPLCARYEAYTKDNVEGFTEGDFRSEGDSPSFLHQIDVGLRSLENPSYGGWGGRFTKDTRGKRVWRGAEEDGDINQPIWRWAKAFQNDWAARADWCVKPPAQANHPPAVVLAHAADLKAEPGETVRLSARNATDPDGNKLSFLWWQYVEPGSYRDRVKIDNADQVEGSFIVPADAADGATIHLVCDVTDNGSPPLTRYARVIVTITRP